MGGATQVAGQEVTPESLNDIKVAVKQNAKELTIPTSTGAKSVHVANEILQEHQSFGYQSQPDFEGALKKYLTEQFHHSPPLTDEIVIAMLNQSSHLFEDHQGNGYIGVNKQILDLNSTRLARNIFWMGLGHELAHESQGALEGKSLRDFEETQEKKDRRAFWQFQRSPTNEERQSLATIITPGTFKLISHFNSETQPVYQFATTPLLDPTTQVPINSEGLEKYFVAPGTTANRVSRFLRENDNSSYRELTLKDPENPEVQVVIRKVYLGPKSTHVSYAVDKANIYNLVNLFGLKRVEDFSAKAPGPSDVVITKNGVERMGLPTRKAVALSHKLNSAFGPLTTARQGQKSNPFMSNGQKIVGEAKMIAGVPVWTVTREDWETINSTPQKEMGASGLFYRLGIHSPRLIALVEDTVVALFTIWGLTYFDFTLSGDSLSALIFGIVDVSFTLGSLAFVGLFLLHFFTGVVQPGGKVFKVNFAEILIRRKAYYVLQLIYHKRLSARATRTASASLLMIPFFAVAFFLNAPSFVVLGFVLAAAMHNYRDGAIEREALAGSLFGGGMQNAGRRLSDTNLTSTQSVPQVQPVQLIREEKPDLTDLFQALSDLKELDFSPTLHEYAVIMQSPEHVDDFLNFLEQLSLETRPTKLGNFMLAPYLTPHSDSDIRKSVKLAKTDENFRRFLARWALIELMLVSEGRQDLSPPHPLLRLAYTIEHFIIELSGDQVDTSSRLKRAAQMAAILRAAGSSISDPSHKGNRDEDIKGDHLLLMSAWGIAGNPQSAGTPFYETYNEILRTAASTTIWNDIINPPSHQKNQKAIYFNIDTLLKQEGSVAGQKAAKSIAMILENQREAENIRLILVYTLRPGGLTNQDLLTRFNAIMFKEYGIQTRNISVDDLLSVNNASGLVVPTTRHLRLSTIQAHATQLKSSTIELWTHAPEKIEKETNVEIRIVDFNRLDKFIEERLKRILFFSIQA
jgi:hypothetical protein